jgi:hypothetical protein
MVFGLPLTHPQSLAKLPTSRFVGNDPHIPIRITSGLPTIHELVCFQITRAAADIRIREGTISRAFVERS